MSIRAYRVVKIETAKPESFNVSQDDKLVAFLNAGYGFFERMGGDGGLTEVPVEALQDALAELDLRAEIREALTKDIAAAEEEGEEYVQYFCY